MRRERLALQRLQSSLCSRLFLLPGRLFGLPSCLVKQKRVDSRSDGASPRDLVMMLAEDSDDSILHRKIDAELIETAS